MDRRRTVSRGALWGGLAVGISTAVAGYHAVPALGLEGGLAALAELFFVALAMGSAFGTWRWSARGSELDTPTGAQDLDHADDRDPPSPPAGE